MIDLIMGIKGTPHALVWGQLTRLIQCFGAWFGQEELFDINEVEISTPNLHLDCRPFFSIRSVYNPGLLSVFKTGVEPASRWWIQIETKALVIWETEVISEHV